MERNPSCRIVVDQLVDSEYDIGLSVGCNRLLEMGDFPEVVANLQPRAVRT